MLPFQILALGLLVGIFIQDLKDRSVHWLLFPLLTATLFLIRSRVNVNVIDILQLSFVNLGFLVLQLAILTVYFSLKNRQWINIADHLLGWGDILFLVSIAFYLSTLNYLFFYITSLSATLVIWLSWQALATKKNKFIPLAGLQCLIFILFLASDWWFKFFDLTNDAWLLHLITR